MGGPGNRLMFPRDTNPLSGLPAAPAGPDPRGDAPTGFHGSLANLPLVDVIQILGGNRFSGLLAVAHGGQQGRLYFVDGEIVHAEAGDHVGELAARIIIGWPRGSFDLHPNTATIERTIRKKLSPLLLDVHHALDEHRRTSERMAPVGVPKEPPRMSWVDQVRALPGVVYAVRFGKEGTPIGDGGPQAEALAARGFYLAQMIAEPAGALLGLRDLGVAAVRSASEQLLLFHVRGSYLCLAVAPDVSVDRVEADVRAIQARPEKG